MRRAFTAGVLAALTVVGGACGTIPSRSSVPSATPGYAPKINPAEFSTTIDNPFYPLAPGTRMIYESKGLKDREGTVVEVTYDTKPIMGVRTVVVHDVVTVNGKLSEDTYDWYAQHRNGDVWYFGEDTKKYDTDGKFTTKGSFLAGGDGAQPGIVMLGNPKVGVRYRQEYYKGQAEDEAEVIDTNASAKVAYGSFDHVVKTKDYTVLDPKVIEHKYFARGVGLILVEHVKGPRERVELVKLERF